MFGRLRWHWLTAWKCRLALCFIARVQAFVSSRPKLTSLVRFPAGSFSEDSACGLTSLVLGVNRREQGKASRVCSGAYPCFFCVVVRRAPRSQWMLHWWRVNGSIARELFHCVHLSMSSTSWTKCTIFMSRVWYGREWNPAYQFH